MPINTIITNTNNTHSVNVDHEVEAAYCFNLCPSVKIVPTLFSANVCSSAKLLLPSLMMFESLCELSFKFAVKLAMPSDRM